LSLAVDRQLALPPMLEAFAEDAHGAQRDRVLRLATLLRSGADLPDALGQVPHVVPHDVVLAARFGAQSGLLGAALRSSASSLARTHDQVSYWLRGSVLYLCALATVLIGILAFVMVKIVPTFQDVFDEFEIPLPGTTATLIELSEFCVQYWYLLVLPPLLLVVLLLAGGVERSARQGLLAHVSRPLIGLHMADVMRNLAIVVQAGRPLPGAVSTLARFHYDPVIKRRLLYVRNELEHGADLWNSMREVGLLSGEDADMLEASRVAGNQAWALNQIAKRKTSRAERRIGLMLELVRPILLIGAGAIVGFVVVSLFAPLISLIHSLA
jgi:type II secretory pathway component PulF